jgi:hypothetical protein
MLNFKTWLEQNTVGTHNDYATNAYVSSTVSGSEVPDTQGMLGHPPFLTSQDLLIKGVPTVERKGEIKAIDTKRDPCFIYLSDGTQLYIPHQDLLKRVQGVPQVGKNMRIVFQRHPLDQSQNPSQIAWAIVY